MNYLKQSTVTEVPGMEDGPMIAEILDAFLSCGLDDKQSQEVPALPHLAVLSHRLAERSRRARQASQLRVQ